MPDTAVVYWHEEQGYSAHAGMLPKSNEFRVMRKVIRCSDIYLKFGVWESVTDSFLVSYGEVEEMAL